MGAGAESCVTELIVHRTLLLILQNLVGLLNFLELLLGGLVVRIAVRVEALGLFAVGPLELVVGGAL